MLKNKTVFVVSHPDDETLWAGGLIQQTPGAVVICCSIPRRDPVRADKFVDACRVLGATPRLIMVEESAPNEPLPGVDFLDLEEFDHIITHGAAGEYGHYHHMFVHHFVKNKYHHKKLSFFGFREGEQRGEHRLNLDDEMWETKFHALQKYNHVSPSDGMEKWIALLNRYEKQGYEIGVESYDGAKI